jgi:hypothetical protein
LKKTQMVVLRQLAIKGGERTREILGLDPTLSCESPYDGFLGVLKCDAGIIETTCGDSVDDGLNTNTPDWAWSIQTCLPFVQGRRDNF